MTNKLEDTFNIDGGDDRNVVIIYELTIPANAELSDISKLALDAYKMQMENLQHLEPQYRTRSLEVAKQYLELAKSAIAEDLKLKQSQDKLDHTKNPEEGGEKEKTTGESSGYSRHDLLMALTKHGQRPKGPEEPKVPNEGTG